MRKREHILVFWLLIFFHVAATAQQAEYNMGSNWVYPTAQKYVGMDFINATTGTLVNNGTISYSENFTNNGDVNFVNTLATNPALSQFSGTTQQHISGTGSTRFYSMQFNNQLTAGAYSLEQNIKVAHQADFTKGIVTTLQTTPETVMNMVLFETGATSINASDNSFVDGFVSKVGNDAFTFPIGNGGFYRPVGISAPANATDAFVARYIYANPDNAGYTHTQLQAPLMKVSDKEYWVINQTSGTSTGQVTLSWDVNKTSATTPAYLKALTVARWDGTKWINEGNVSTTGDITAGTVTANVTGYGIFTLGSTLLNPPVAVNDTINSFENVSSTGNLLANDQVSNGTALTVTGFTVAGTAYTVGATAIIASAGTITVAADGTYTFKPALNYSGTVPTITYSIADDAGLPATGNVIIHVFALPEFQKSSSKATMNNDGTYSWTYTLSVHNNTALAVDNIQLTDNLDDVFKNKNCTYTITSIIATGSLKSNGLYNGSGDVNTLLSGSSLAVGRLDSIRIEVKVDTHSQIDSIEVSNQATLTGIMGSTKVSMLSDDKTVDGTQNPTKTIIPPVHIFIPNAFSPNGDGINDKLIIVHDTNSKIELEIFNRDGGLVYKSSDYQNDWAGKGTNGLLGSELADGTYFISFKMINKSTGEIITKGVRYITLRR